MSDSFEIEFTRLVRLLNSAPWPLPAATVEAARGVLRHLAQADDAARSTSSTPPEPPKASLPSALTALSHDARIAGADLETLTAEVVRARRAVSAG